MPDNKRKQPQKYAEETTEQNNNLLKNKHNNCNNSLPADPPLADMSTAGRFFCSIIPHYTLQMQGSVFCVSCLTLHALFAVKFCIRIHSIFTKQLILPFDH